MPTTTTNLKLTKPDRGQTDWDTLVNGNFNIIDSEVSSKVDSSCVVVGEIPSGVINGTNKVFTLRNSPNPSSSCYGFKNGVALFLGADFTLSGNTITLADAPLPSDGVVPADTLRFCYIHK